jgi:hypothetical protein
MKTLSKRVYGKLEKLIPSYNNNCRKQSYSYSFSPFLTSEGGYGHVHTLFTLPLVKECLGVSKFTVVIPNYHII